MHVYLKVKLKSLAEEARIIRLEERRAKHAKRLPLLFGLRSHRVGIVRDEARRTHVAYAILRGKPEPCNVRAGDKPLIDKMVRKYGPPVTQPVAA